MHGNWSEVAIGVQDAMVRYHVMQNCGTGALRDRCWVVRYRGRLWVPVLLSLLLRFFALRPCRL